MPSYRLAFAALAVTCVGAAAAGGYFATRRSTVPPEASATFRTQGVTAEPVQETEQLVEETAPPQTQPVGAASATRARVSTPKRADAARTAPVLSIPAQPSSQSSWAGGKPSDPLPSLDRPGPSSVAANATQVPPGVALPPTPSLPPDAVPTTPRPDDRSAQDTSRIPELPQKNFEELVVPADSVIGLQSETSISSERARIEDRVEARVTRDVRVHDAVAVPAGARALGTVVSVERGGKLKDRARLGIRFNMLVLGDGSRVPISTDTIYRDGDPPGNQSAAKIGGAAVGGAILGAIFGGSKGAAIGATAGAGAGSASVAASERSTASLRAGEPITVRLLSPVSVTIEQK